MSGASPFVMQALAEMWVMLSPPGEGVKGRAIVSVVKAAGEII
jgi:hypothetical protein